MRSDGRGYSMTVSHLDYGHIEGGGRDRDGRYEALAWWVGLGLGLGGGFIVTGL